MADLQSAAINRSATCARCCLQSVRAAFSLTYQARASTPTANRAGTTCLEGVTGGLRRQDGKQYNQIRLSVLLLPCCLKRPESPGAGWIDGAGRIGADEGI